MNEPIYLSSSSEGARKLAQTHTSLEEEIIMAEQNPANETSTDFSRFRLRQNFGNVSGVKKEVDHGAGSQAWGKRSGLGFILRKRWTLCSCHTLKVAKISTWSNQSFKRR